MTRVSVEAGVVLGDGFVESVRASDRDEWMAGVVGEGWVLEEGANLLVALRDSYFGERSRFVGVGDYEAAVNGRGIPDLDLEVTGRERIAALMRRGVAMVWDALYSAQALPWKPTLTGRVSVAPTLMDPEVHTGYFWIFSARFAGELGAAGELPGLQVVLESGDYVRPLR